ncbi:MAG: hypothetical protein K2O70_00955, partial [Desulfovibrionaceae bacterium]|nr:hypothetical protein [Desulfovibrionaceae bacterium]
APEASGEHGPGGRGAYLRTGPQFLEDAMTTMIDAVLRRERSRRRMADLRRAARVLLQSFAGATLIMLGMAVLGGIGQQLEQRLDRQNAVALHPGHPITMTER